MNANDDYSDILLLPHPDPQHHTRMPLAARAAQFAPFSALTGYDDCINEAARLTDSRPELSESEQALLDRKLARLRQALAETPLPSLVLTIFRPDSLKSGGLLLDVTVSIQAIDDVHHALRLPDGELISFHDIINMQSPLFDDLE